MTAPMDPEIKAMNAILAAMADENLTNAMRERIVAWVKARYATEPMMRQFIAAADKITAAPPAVLRAHIGGPA